MCQNRNIGSCRQLVIVCVGVVRLLKLSDVGGRQRLWGWGPASPYLIESEEDWEEDLELGPFAVGSSNPFWKKSSVISPTHFRRKLTKYTELLYYTPLPAQNMF